jgi:hypothetical protein
MHSTSEHDPTEQPLMRIITLGEFALERLVRSPSLAQDEPARENACHGASGAIVDRRWRC